MSAENNQTDGSVRIDMSGERLELPSTKYNSAAIPLVIGLVVGIVISLGMLGVFKDGCTESWQVKSPFLMEVSHYRPLLMVVCIFIMSIVCWGLYAVYSWFVVNLAREDRKTEEKHQDSLLKQVELLNNMIAPEMKKSQSRAIDVNINYRTEPNNPQSSDEKGSIELAQNDCIKSYKYTIANDETSLSAQVTYEGK